MKEQPDAPAQGIRVTCTKEYVDLPFGHRQPSHDGHCALIHGHGWSFHFTFSATAMDACGFVVDFGKLGWLKDWLESHFDHTLVLNADDPLLVHIMRELADYHPPLAKVVPVPDCSCEGLARYVLERVGALVLANYGGRVSLDSVTVHEDHKNSATAARA